MTMKRLKSIILEATELAKEINIEPIIEHSQGRILARRVRINDPKLHLKVNFSNFSLDVANNRITERFEQLKEHNDIFLFLYEIKKIKIMTRDELIKYCADLQLVLTDGDSADINGIEMADELIVLTTMVQSNLSLIELLKFVINAGDCSKYRLSGLAMVAIEHELAEQLNDVDMVKDFANAKARKCSFNIDKITYLYELIMNKVYNFV
ncbi:hypothetical protein QTP88_017912 [Uroleucon formosanum]